MSVMFLEGCLICYLNFMFNCNSFTQVQVAVGKQVSPFEQHSLASSCSGLGHSPSPWRSRASKTHPFWGLLLDSSEVPVGRSTSGTWLAGMTWPTTVFVGILMEWVLRCAQRDGYLMRTPDVTLHRSQSAPLLVGNWEPGVDSVSTWTHIQCPLTLVLLCTLIVLKGGNSDPPCGVDWTSDIIQARIPSPPQCQSSERKRPHPFPPQFHLSPCGVDVVTQTWHP